MTSHDFQPSFEYIKAQQQLFLETKSLSRSDSRSAMSETTEIIDSDYDTDSRNATSDSEPYRSADSLVAESVTTLSTLDEIKTPDSTGLTSFHFHLDDSPIKGPQGPHLFRTSEDSLSRPQLTPDWTDEKAPDSAVATHFYTGFKTGPNRIEPERKDTPVVDVTAQTPPPPPPAPARPTSRIGVPNWSPNEVVTWLQSLGFEDSIIEKFFINDITGPILLELQIDDLKELEISSFGKRHQLMAFLLQLRNVYPRPYLPTRRQETRTPQTTAAEVGADCTSPIVECDAPRSRSDSRSSSQQQHRQHSRQKRGRHGTEIVPQDSVSIVAIEQLLPKLHVCSKGENCRKWLRQQTKIARLLKDLQVEGLAGSVLVAGDPGSAANAPPATKTPKLECKSYGPEPKPKMESRPQVQEPKLKPEPRPQVPEARPKLEVKPPIANFKPPKPETRSPKSDAKTPKSEVTPSLVASSDIMGMNIKADIHLSQERLNDVQSRDPQENVRNFLSFQRLSTLQPVTDPATPPADHDASLENSPTSSQKGTPTLAENLRHLPKLRIPSLQVPSETTFSPNYSAQRTITPSVYRKSRQFPAVSRVKSPNPYSGLLSPSDFYRHDPHYGQRTPLSSGDAPLTAIRLGPIERGFSQSVPPDMRFGNQADDARPASRNENHRRLHSAVNGPSFRPMVPVVERSPLPPIDTLEDLENTPRAPHCRNNPFSPNSAHANDIIHNGWMKKRKTTKLIRHEWEENHFTLRGTHLCMYPDEQAALRDSKALERIDVDDYAVACSSLRSTSKLTAAFKKTVLKRVNDSQAPAAFAFSLIPASTTERKTLMPGGPKSHHFSVETQQERIDWMRELMLAKALRRGREGGDSVNLNGQPF
ncbi:uncharacterized protein DSM5745_08848 [Aspergillus mulundensis]|uniref:SAM and PH domain protein n=1 Tax=Aspergillus mulundensis TaxID=1810919 RepID=A0A3D8R544_9EURO|nr:hypothetical protein DSM5745_08848 [Aspergillus mulundensis]RDW69088.1 hypothetical protein DSM5745_08848 [Aspergillus mulundensis]